MDAINQIINETFFHLKTINTLKNDFWIHIKSTNDDKPILQIFNRISNYNKAAYIQKIELSRFMLPNLVNTDFLDFFFYVNAQTEYVMTLLDFQSFMLKFISTSNDVQITHGQSTIEELFRRIFIAEENFYLGIEPFKKRLTSQFRDVSELFNFLKLVFEDVSSFSPRAEAKVVDFAKLNSQLRLKNNYPVITLTEMSYFLNYFQICNDGGITFDEFLSIFIDSVNLNRYYMFNMERRLEEVKSSPFLPLNLLPKTRNLSEHNFDLRHDDEDFKIRPTKKFVKNMLIDGFDSHKDHDVIVLSQQVRPVQATSSTVDGPKRVIRQNYLHEEKQKNVNIRQPKSDLRRFDYKFEFIADIEHDETAQRIDEISMQQSFRHNDGQVDSFIHRNIDEFRY